MPVRTLVFDTETDGVIKKGMPKPYLVQLAGILFEGRRPVGHLSCFCIPEHNGIRAEIPKEKFFLESGITDEIVDSVGVPYRVALGMFNNLLRHTDRLVAHNIGFDNPITREAYIRSGSPTDVFDKVPKFCTMMSLVDELKIPGRFGKQYKWPSLDESYRALVNPEGFTGAHDAMVDVMACAEVLWAAEDRGVNLWQMKEQ